MTDQSPFDPAALLAEWTRVHEAAERAQVALAGSDPLAPATHTLLLALNAADEHRARTYSALLDVARGLVEERDEADRQLRGLALHTTEWFRVKSHRDMMDRFLSRLAAAGGGR